MLHITDLTFSAKQIAKNLRAKNNTFNLSWREYFDSPLLRLTSVFLV